MNNYLRAYYIGSRVVQHARVAAGSISHYEGLTIDTSGIQSFSFDQSHKLDFRRRRQTPLQLGSHGLSNSICSCPHRHIWFKDTLLDTDFTSAIRSTLL
jgi:hypothetical protein